MISFEEIIPSVLFSAPFPEKRETQTQATAKIAQAYGSVVLWVHQMSSAITKTLKKTRHTVKGPQNLVLFLFPHVRRDVT